MGYTIGTLTHRCGRHWKILWSSVWKNNLKWCSHGHSRSCFRAWSGAYVHQGQRQTLVDEKREYLPCGAFKAARIGEVHWLYSPAHRFCRVPHPPGDLRMVIGDSFYRQRWKALETLFAARRCRGEGPVRVGVSVGVSELFLVDLPVFRDLPSRDLRWFKQPLNGRISDISLHHRISLDMIFHPWRIHFAHAGKDLRHPEIQFFSPLAVDQRLLEKIGIPWNSSYCQRLSMGPTNHSAWFSSL